MQVTQRKKINRDMWSDFNRTLLLILGIFVGILSVCLIIDSFSVLKRESSISYINTEPASFSLWLNDIDDDLVEELKKDELLDEVEPRRMVRSRIINDKGDPVETYLYVVDDFNDIRINKFSFSDGASPPQKGEVLMEELSANVVGCEPGDNAELKIPLYSSESVRIKGIVKAPGFKPAWIEKCAYCFIGKDTFEEMGGSTDFIQVLFTVKDHKEDKEHISEVAYRIREKIIESGHMVNRCEINEPNEHPNAKQINALMFLFEIFAALNMILSGVLIINLISVLLNNQKKQIGIMKAVGAKNSSIGEMYYAMVARISVIALCLAVPAAYFLSKKIVVFCADMLNIEISSFTIPHYLVALEISVGIIIPMAAASFSIVRYCGKSIKSCLFDGQSGIGSGFKRVSFLSRWKNLILKMGISNSVRNLKKLLILVITISVGGAVFIISINLRASLDNTIANAQKRINYDFLAVASKNYDCEAVDKALEGAEWIRRKEYISGGMAFYTREDRIQSNSFLLAGLPKDADIFDYPVISGKGLSYNGDNEIVINQLFHSEHPDVKIGDSIQITTNKKTGEWKVVGIVKEIGGDEAAYVNQTEYNKFYIDNENEYVREIAFFLDENGGESSQIYGDIEKRLSDNGIDIQNTNSINDVQSAFANHLKLIAGFLMIVSLMVIVVGLISLVSFITVNISERAKELGIMMSIGGRHIDIIKIFMCESGVIAVLSLFVSALAAFPLTIYLSKAFGRIFLEAPLDWVYSFKSLMIWFVLISLCCMAVSHLAVKKFLNKPVCEIINYE
ncbi:FtsX-like permease family protein [uncultured Ruminococcus sp.]|uniref:FtsX-like permease family protein n=1 Tax=uncultured Ruminococcus sp. TaxID=165186 RepID=UPI00261045EC|nr:FtsX-like permease family protein [uncultured Ruminococcus sp.]